MRYNLCYAFLDPLYFVKHHDENIKNMLVCLCIVNPALLCSVVCLTSEQTSDQSYLVVQMLHDLNTYLHKAIPDTKLTIRKYLDVKFEYLVRRQHFVPFSFILMYSLVPDRFNKFTIENTLNPLCLSVVLPEGEGNG